MSDVTKVFSTETTVRFLFQMFSDDDFANKSLMKAPPSEKPPPPPPEESCQGPGKGTGEGGDGDDDEIDQQERQIIASLEMEEREHNRYIMEQKMKRLPSNLSSNSSATINTGKRYQKSTEE